MKRLLLLIATIICLAAPTAAYAYNPLQDACTANSDGNGSSNSTACPTDGSKDPITGQNGILKKASMVIATIAGIAAVIIIIVSGFQYVTSNGDAQRTVGARNTLLGAIIGLLIIIGAQAIILLVLSKL